MRIGLDLQHTCSGSAFSFSPVGGGETSIVVVEVDVDVGFDDVDGGAPSGGASAAPRSSICCPRTL
jgi:hypothetical protein